MTLSEDFKAVPGTEVTIFKISSAPIVAFPSVSLRTSTHSLGGVEQSIPFLTNPGDFRF